MYYSNFIILYDQRKLLDWKYWWKCEQQEGLNSYRGFRRGFRDLTGLVQWVDQSFETCHSKLDLSLEVSTVASTDLPSEFYKRKRIKNHQVLTQSESEKNDENNEPNDKLEGEDEIKARFDRRLIILKRACSVLPQLRGANDLASHDQLIRKGF